MILKKALHNDQAALGGSGGMKGGAEGTDLGRVFPAGNGIILPSLDWPRRSARPSSACADDFSSLLFMIALRPDRVAHFATSKQCPAPAGRGHGAANLRAADLHDAPSIAREVCHSWAAIMAITAAKSTRPLGELLAFPSHGPIRALFALPSKGLATLPSAHTIRVRVRWFEPRHLRFRWPDLAAFAKPVRFGPPAAHRTHQNIYSYT